MKLILDKYCYLDSPIHQWEQKSKLISLLILIFSVAFVTKLILLPIILLITIVLFSLSNLPLNFLLSRLRYPGFFIFALIIFIPFFAGKTVILDLGILTIKQEGCLEVIKIITRFFSILTISLILFGTAPFLTTIKALKSLGLSAIIVDMILLSYRYLEELGLMLTTMQRSMKLRGFHPHNFSKKNLQIMAALMGSLLVRSYEQSQRIYQAMILRGYGTINNNHLLHHGYIKLDQNSWLFSVIIVTISIGLMIAEFSL